MSAHPRFNFDKSSSSCLSELSQCQHYTIKQSKIKQSKTRSSPLQPGMSPPALSNSLRSPVLQLPAEIRSKIREYVLGGHMIHIFYDPKLTVTRYSIRPGCLVKRKGLQHTIRTAPETELQAYHHSRISNLLPYTPYAYGFRINCEIRHGQCYRAGRALSAENIMTRQGQTLSLALLQISRIIYEETHLLPYRANTFSFHTVECVSRLLHFSIIPQSCIGSIRTLHLSFQSSLARNKDTEYGLWSATVTPRFINKFRGVRRLHVCIEEGAQFNCNPKSSQYEQIVSKFSELSLDIAIVVMTTRDLGAFDMKHGQPDGDDANFIAMRKHRLSEATLMRQVAGELQEIMCPGSAKSLGPGWG